MPLIFPGMDPYLENPAIFPGIHSRMIVYLADQIEETDKRLDAASDPTQVAFLNRVLAMYTQELENRNQGLTGRISAITQDVSSRVRPSLFRWKNG